MRLRSTMETWRSAIVINRLFRPRSVALKWEICAMILPLFLFVFAATFENIVASPHAKPFAKWKRQASGPTNGTRVDLGYEIYEGVANSSTNLITHKGCVHSSPAT